MPGNQSGGSSRKRIGSQLVRIHGQGPMLSSADVSDHEGTEETEARANRFFHQRNESSPSRTSFSSSLNQKTPARSYFQHSFQDSHSEAQYAQTLPVCTNCQQSHPTSLGMPLKEYERILLNWRHGRCPTLYQTVASTPPFEITLPLQHNNTLT